LPVIFPASLIKLICGNKLDKHPCILVATFPAIKQGRSGPGTLVRTKECRRKTSYTVCRETDAGRSGGIAFCIHS
jgi:hypothetical protein